MAQFFEKYKKRIISLLVIAAIALAFISSGISINASLFESAIGVVVTPFQDIITGVTSWTQTTVDSARERTNLVEENQQLKETVATLQAENRRLSLYEQENENLSNLLKTSQKYPDYTTIVTSVIAKNPGAWFDVFTIDAGTSDGASADMILVAPGGVVGKIVESGLTYSKAQSMLDTRSSIPAMSLRTGDLGVVKGDYVLMNDGLCKMEYIDADAEIMVGDEIVTSSLSDVYPVGLSIGRVVNIETDANGLTKYAVIEPFVDLKHIDTLLIIDKNNTEDLPS